jgi:hypothetical protein
VLKSRGAEEAEVEEQEQRKGSRGGGAGEKVCEQNRR